MRRLLTTAALCALAFSFCVPAPAEEPPHVTFSPAAPGSVVQSQVVYLAGQAMHSQWRAVVSKRVAGKGSGVTFYQWYLSIYQIDDTTYRLRYQSPRDGGPLDKVDKASGGDMWYPLQSAQIVGSAMLMQPAVEQLIVSSHQTGADCGSANISVMTVTPSGKVVPAVTLQNSCDLRATVSRGSGSTPDALILNGPYYNATAPNCCPTKAKAVAVLRYRNGRWTETPKYFSFYPNSFPK
ncbi:MAG TPA: hypothetical protein VGF18_07790 [Candidatus Tumulicola sp.]|jgi:hypothetical protein